jgi:hypothetical protein
MVGIQTCKVDAKLEPVYVGPWNLVLIEPHMFWSLTPYTFVGQYQCFGETRFTMETERGSHIPFLDIDIYRKLNGHSGHKSIQEAHSHKPVSECHISPPPCNKQAVLCTLVHRT